MYADNLASIEKLMKDSKELIDFGNAVERLRSNRDFKRVITEGYFEKEAIRLVQLKSDPAMQSPASQTAILSAMDGIGQLIQYLQDAVRTGELAAKQLEDCERERETMMEEGVENV